MAETSFSPAFNLHELLRNAGRRHATAEALLTSGRRPCTYGQLNEQVDYVGHVFRHYRIRRSDRVAIVLPNGPEMAAAFLGSSCFSCSAPLNPNSTEAEFEFYLRDLRVQAVIASASDESSARDVGRRLGLRILELAELRETAATFLLNDIPRNAAVPADSGGSGDTALVLHTSGTTSRPKLVPLSHSNLCASAHHIATTLQLVGEDRCLNMMPLFHIHGLVGALLSSIQAGGSVVCTPGYDANAFPRWFAEFQPTWYSAVPTIHQSILAETKARPAGGHSLRFIRSSSAALPPQVMQDLEHVFGVPVVESYGMTEAAHQIASNPLPPAIRKPGSVGLPSGPETAIVDGEGRLLAGETGEIAIRGPNVTAGYLENSEANGAAFKERWFLTGDMGYFDSDGYLYISGRKKELINRGGEKISPREIDELLLEHEDVAQAVTFSVPHPSLGEDVAAAVILRSHAVITESALRRFLYSRLAPFKVPSRIIFVSEIPKGPTGKLQRIGLHEKFSGLLRGEYVAPQNDLERQITAVFADILEVDRVGAADNFFALGGDSIKAGRVIARISSAYQIDIPAVTLFHHPTPAELGVEVIRRLGEGSSRLEHLLDEIEQMSDDELRRAVDSQD